MYWHELCTWLVRALVDPLIDWRSTIYISYFSFYLHQLQPSTASASASSFFSSQLPFAIDAKGGEMSLLGGACCQLSSMTKGEIVGQSEPCMVCLSLMFVIDVNWVFDCGLILGLGPLWSPSCVPFWCVVWETFSSYSSPSLKPLGALWNESKAPLGVCVVFSSLFYYFLWPIL